MCFYATVKYTKEEAARISRTKKGEVTRWKVVEDISDPRKPAVLVSENYHDYVWTPGEHKSRTKRKRSKRGSNMSEGFYVYLQRSTALEVMDGATYMRLLPVTVKEEDLIGADAYSACYANIRVSKDAYRKAAKGV